MDTQFVLRIALFLIPFVFWLVYKIIKSSQPGMIEKINTDKRRPVLYLRSFEDSGVGPKVDIALVPTSIINDQFFSYEQLISKMFKPIGPFIAIGDPETNEKLIGVYTDQFADNDWQTIVSALLEEARIIVFKPASSDGLLWEFNEIVQKNFLQKTIIYTQVGKYEDEGVRRALYNKFRRKVAHLVQKDLPEYSSRQKYIYFDMSLNPFLTSDPRKSIIYKQALQEIHNEAQVLI